MQTPSSRLQNTLLIAALAGSIMLAALGISIATVALPSLARAFSTDVQAVQWVVLSYLLTVTAAIVVVARLGDIHGNRRVLVVGVALFTLASAGCALAPGLGWLITGRVVQGLGAAILMSLPLSMAKALVAKERLGAAMGLLGTLSAVGTALGPALGGALVGVYGWRSVFALLTLCGVGLLALLLSGLFKAESTGPSACRIDWAGSVWLSTALAGLGLSAAGGRLGVRVQPWMLMTLAAVALLMFIRTELTVANPLVPVALVRGRVIALSLSMNLLVGMLMMATLVVGPFFLSFGLGLSDAETGLVMAAGPIAAALSGVPAGRAVDRFGADRTLMAGLLLTFVGLVAFATLAPLVGVRGYVLALLLMTPGFQLFLAANNTLVMVQADPEHRGLLAGLLGLSRNLGLIAGASLPPLLFTSLLGQHALADSTAPVIGHAFHVTFLAAASLAVLALLLGALKKA
ncbi:MFS transporter [Pseudomonas syringae]|nr:MFS transporter [Pseudomonas syringae]